MSRACWFASMGLLRKGAERLSLPIAVVAQLRAQVASSRAKQCETPWRGPRPMGRSSPRAGARQAARRAFPRWRSGRRCDAGCVARGLRPQHLVLRPFELPAVARPNDCFVPISVRTTASGQRQHPAAKRAITGPIPVGMFGRSDRVVLVDPWRRANAGRHLERTRISARSHHLSCGSPAPSRKSGRRRFPAMSEPCHRHRIAPRRCVRQPPCRYY